VLSTIRSRALLVSSVAVTAVLLAGVSTAEAAPSVRFTRVYVNSPGTDDGSNTSLNAEWVRIANFSSTNRTMTGWTIKDNNGYRFTFPTFVLKAGASVKVHTGKGTNTAGHLYWGRTWYVWNNAGDKAMLRQVNKTAIHDECSWGSVSSYTNC